MQLFIKSLNRENLGNCPMFTGHSLCFSFVSRYSIFSFGTEIEKERIIFVFFNEPDRFGGNGIRNIFINPQGWATAFHVSDPADSVYDSLEKSICFFCQLNQCVDCVPVKFMFSILPNFPSSSCDPCNASILISGEVGFSTFGKNCANPGITERTKSKKNRSQIFLSNPLIFKLSGWQDVK